MAEETVESLRRKLDDEDTSAEKKQELREWLDEQHGFTIQDAATGIVRAPAEPGFFGSIRRVLTGRRQRENAQRT